MAEDTLMSESERANLLADMLAKTPATEIIPEFAKNPVVDDGKETGTPTVIHKITSAGYYYVWNTRTFEKVPVLYYMLQQVLRQRRPDGSFEFTLVDPKKEPVHGTIKCMLHPDGPDRKEYDAMGFRTCKKANLTNNWQLQRHMQLKHKEEWKAIEESRKAKERQEDRELQRMLLLLGQERASNAPVRTPFTCETCGAVFDFQRTLDKHKDIVHNDGK